MNAKFKSMALSWFRAAAASAIALYLTGVTDLKTLAMAAVAGFAGPALKYLDSSATEFGIGAE